MIYLERDKLGDQGALTAGIIKFEAVFAKELTPALAHDYVASLLKKLDGVDQSYNQFLEKGNELHYGVGKDIYGPLITGYVQWLTDHCVALGHEGNVFFALRDAAPLQVATEVIWGGTSLTPVEVYANRPLLGIEDEIAPENSMENGEVLAYLANKGLGSAQQAVWADTGAWGTVVKALKINVLAHSPIFPFFWYSHNPHIPGYLNELLAYAQMDEGIGEVLNDSLECMFPQQHLRPLTLTQDSSEIILVPSNHLSVLWGQAALDGVKAAAQNYKSRISLDEQVAQVRHLEFLHHQAARTGEWMGVLPTNTPTWSQGDAFLKAWPSTLLP